MKALKAYFLSLQGRERILISALCVLAAAVALTFFAKKAAALKLLRCYEKFAGHPLYLLEDAAYRELRFAGDEIPSALAAPGGSERVLYAGTFSKPFATGVRVGFGVLPEPVLTTATRIKGNHDFGTANLLQQMLARALATGAYERLAGKIRLAVDPKAPHNRVIVDLDKAERDTDGRVRFSADFCLLQPVDAAKSAGRLLMDVANRGRKLTVAINQNVSRMLGLRWSEPSGRSGELALIQ